MLAPRPALAGPVNTDKLRGGEDQPGLGLSLDLGVSLAQGNVRRFELRSAGGLSWQRFYAAQTPGRPPWLRDQVVLVGSSNFMTAFGNRLLNRAMAHTRWTAMWHRRIGSSFFAQIQYDEFLSLQRRALLGASASTILVHRDRVRWRLSSGYMVEFERNVIRVPDDPHPAHVINHRWSNAMTLDLGIVEDRALLLRSTTFVQPRFDDPSDLRILEGVQLEGRIDRFALGLDAEVQWDSRPPLGVYRLDLVVASYLRVNVAARPRQHPRGRAQRRARSSPRYSMPSASASERPKPTIQLQSANRLRPS